MALTHDDGELQEGNHWISIQQCLKGHSMWEQALILLSVFLGALVSPVLIRLVEDKLQRQSRREESRRQSQLETVVSLLERLKECHVLSLREVDRKRQMLVSGVAIAPAPEPSELNDLAQAAHGIRTMQVRLLDGDLRELIQEYVNDTAGLINQNIYQDVAHVLKERGHKYERVVNRLGDQFREYS